AERARLERQDSALEAELLQRKADVAAFDDRERMILQHRDDIVRLFGRSAACGADRARTAGLETEIGGLEVELDEVAGEILEGSWRDVSAASVEAIPIELLRSRVGQLHASRPSARRPEPPRSMDAVLVAALLAGIALLAWGLASGGPVATAFGAGASAVALTLGIAARRSRMSDASFAGGPAGESARSEVLSLLARLPIQANHLDEPREGLVTELARLQALLGDRGRCTRALESALRRIRELDDEAARLGRTLRLPHAREAEGTAHALDLDLRKAERLQDVAETAARELRRLARGRDDVAVVLAEMAPELQALRGLGERLAPGNARAGLELAKDRLDAHRRADELEEELERNHPNLDELRARLRADEASGATTSEELGDERLARTRARVEALEEEIEQLVKACESLARDAEHLRELETVDVVDSEIASLREAEARLARERDRKWVLAKLLRQADRRFREEHQPDLLRRASSYLSHLTGGRYERLVVDERPEADLFQVVGPGLPAPVPLAPPVSTGTLEQAYLSLRFAIVDHLDQGGEKLPLFIDEVFVNWDRRRRARGLEVLAGISSQRQVFVFTCHRELAEELRAHGGRVLSLEPVV
ncbi:MAG TPA: hypothetical protein VLA09_04430, partial [Longimicrobiales bacterium]|nr:hypothetical protein [Longimicrobiales bacterium]